MRTNIKPENRRLLEAVEYIDENIILGVLSELRMPKEKHIEPLLTWRTPLKHWKSIAVLAACTVLLAFAAPAASFISQVISNYSSVAGGNAGAGTSELEMPTPTETKVLETEAETIDSPYPRTIDAYPADMSINDIYEDIIKGGWVVLDSDYSKGFLYGNELWTAFIDKVNMKQPTTVLVADMARWAELSHIVTGCHYTKERIPTLFLMEITFDGELFGYKRLDCFKDEITDSGEYRYLITDICEYTADNTIGMISGYRETICLTNDISWTYDSFSKQAFTDEGRTSEFFNNPCQIIATYSPIYETKAGYANPVPRSLGFSELIVD